MQMCHGINNIIVTSHLLQIRSRCFKMQSGSHLLSVFKWSQATTSPCKIAKLAYNYEIIVKKKPKTTKPHIVGSPTHFRMLIRLFMLFSATVRP